jgi:hypothetical protein
MIALHRLGRVICTVLVEAATVALLVAVGRRPELHVPVAHLGAWLREGDPAIVVVALLRWVALVGAGWLLASTLLYLAAAASRVPGAVRAVSWSTLPAARRAIDAACAVSVATTVVLVPAAAGAVRGGRDTTTVSVVRDGRGQLAQLPPDSPTTTTPPPAPTLPPGAAPAPDPWPPPSTATPDEVVVEPGDNLWELAAQHLARTGALARGDVADADIARYWVQVCDANRARLASGDPNLVHPGERVLLPPVS